MHPSICLASSLILGAPIVRHWVALRPRWFLELPGFSKRVIVDLFLPNRWAMTEGLTLSCTAHCLANFTSSGGNVAPVMAARSVSGKECKSVAVPKGAEQTCASK